MRLRRTRPSVCIAAVAAVVALAGCGLGPGPGSTNAQVQVTENFGATTLGSADQKKIPGAETVMSLMQRYFKVTTKYGGGFIESINGHSGGANHNDWFYYVNGIEAQKGAATTSVHKGDHVWWDLHNWTATETIPAVVGSYPEPFTNGLGGQRYPTLLTCAPDVTAACNTVTQALIKSGIKVSDQALGTGSGSDSLAIVVGTFKDLQGVIASELIKAGPSQSGVYAEPVGSSALEIDDPLGDVVTTLRGNVGLIAATEQQNLNQPTWMIEGTTVAGVDAAAAEPDRGKAA